MSAGEVLNSTITGNSATEFGGGIHLGSLGHIRVQSSTIVGNTADSDNTGGGDGGGTYHGSDDPAVTDEFRVANTLYAGNMVGSGPGQPEHPVRRQCLYLIRLQPAHGGRRGLYRVHGHR